ncbi:MAG: toprim domain-containing protein [Tunicatimonas sp.]|uniref:toprim domain-containing protein n=1 Tax=Tunicatimonas sp. TaxID=1940096 RepID=UPI003C73575B
MITIGKKDQHLEVVNYAAGMLSYQWSEFTRRSEQLKIGSLTIPVLSRDDLTTHIAATLDPGLATKVTPSKDQTVSSRPSVATKRTSTHSTANQLIDWGEASRTMNPAQLLEDFGFKHDPTKGSKRGANGQVYKRDGEAVLMYPNPDSKAVLINQLTGEKGDSITFLKSQLANDPHRVNSYIKEHFGGVPPLQYATPRKFATPGKRMRGQPVIPAPNIPADVRSQKPVATRSLQDKYQMRLLDNFAYLTHRNIKKATVEDPSFRGQVLNARGWSDQKEQPVAVDNTVFPMRNDEKLQTIIMKNEKFSGMPKVSRAGAIWQSNPTFLLAKDTAIGEHLIPAGTRASLRVGDPDKMAPLSSTIAFRVAGKLQEVPVSADQVTAIEHARINTRLSRLVVTENPIDALSFHQLMPPRGLESRVYVATGGNHSAAQIETVQGLLKTHQPQQVVFANDRDPAGTKATINQMGALSEGKVSVHLDEKKDHYQLQVQVPTGQAIEKVANSFVAQVNRASVKHTDSASNTSTVYLPKDLSTLVQTQHAVADWLNKNQTQGQSPTFKVVNSRDNDFNQDVKNQAKEKQLKIASKKKPLRPDVNDKLNGLAQDMGTLGQGGVDFILGGSPTPLRPRIRKKPRENVSVRSALAEKKTNLPSPPFRDQQSSVGELPSVPPITRKHRAQGGDQSATVVPPKQTKQGTTTTPTALTNPPTKGSEKRVKKNRKRPSGRKKQVTGSMSRAMALDVLNASLQVKFIQGVPSQVVRRMAITQQKLVSVIRGSEGKLANQPVAIALTKKEGNSLFAVLKHKNPTLAKQLLTNFSKAPLTQHVANTVSKPQKDSLTKKAKVFTSGTPAQKNSSPLKSSMQPHIPKKKGINM